MQQSVQGAQHPGLATPSAVEAAATSNPLAERAAAVQGPSKRLYEDTPSVGACGGQPDDLDVNLFDFGEGPLSPVSASVPHLHAQRQDLQLEDDVSEAGNLVGSISEAQTPRADPRAAAAAATAAAEASEDKWPSREEGGLGTCF